MYEMKQSELSFWIHGIQNSQKQSLEAEEEIVNVTITLRQIKPESQFGPAIITQHQGSVRKPGAWVSVNLTTMVSEWLQRPLNNLGVAVEATGSVEISAGTKNEPHFVMQMQQSRSSKNRRDAADSDCAEGQTTCCRHRRTVNFHELGFDFIIAPSMYVYYCDATYLLLISKGIS